MEFPLLCDIIPREMENTYLKCVAFHPTANPPILAVGFQNRPVELWRFSSDGSLGGGCGTLVGNLDATRVSSIEFHPTANPPILAIDGISGCIELWRVLTLSTGFLYGILVHRFDVAGAVGSIFLAFHPMNGFLASGGYNIPVNLWDLASPLFIHRPGVGLCRETIPGLTEGTRLSTELETSYSTPLMSSRPLLTSASRDMPPAKKGCCTFEIGNERNPNNLDVVPKVRVTSIAFHPTIPLLAFCYDRNEINLWSFSSGVSTAKSGDKRPRCAEGPENPEKLPPLACTHPVDYVAFHPTANPPLLAAGCRGGWIELWTLSPGGSRVHTQNVGNIKYIAFHPMAPVLAIVSHNTVNMWHVSPDGLNVNHLTSLVHPARAEPIRIAFHPTEFVMTTCSTNSIKMWDCRQLSDMWQRNQALKLGGLQTTLEMRLGTEPSTHHSDATRELLAGQVVNTLREHTAPRVVPLSNDALLQMMRARVAAARRKPAGGSSRRIKTKLQKKLKTKPKYTIKYKKYSKRRPIKNKN